MNTLTTPHNVFVTEDLPASNFMVHEVGKPETAIEIPYEAVNGWQANWKESRSSTELQHTHQTNRMSFTSNGVIVKAHRRDKPGVVVTMNFNELMDLYNQYERAWAAYQHSRKGQTTKPVTPRA